MTEQEIKKSVDEIVGKILASEEQEEASKAPAEEVSKAITSESVAPTVVAEAAAPVEQASNINGGATEAIADPTAPSAEVSKSEDEEEDEEDEKEEKSKKSKMKKSIEELAALGLDEDELELIKAWREESEKTEEPVAKSAEAPAPVEQKPAMTEEVLKKAIADSTADLRKAIDEKDTLIKSLSEKVEKLASQPAYDRRSVSNLEVIEKSNDAPASNEIKKSQVLDTMLALQAGGKGITSHHIAEFEATGNISDTRVKRIVFQELKLN